MLYSAARPLLFCLEPESAHEVAFTTLRAAQAVLERLPPWPPAADAALAQELWGLTFPNPIGLAAGFDKNAELPHVWPTLGFGFAELGTVTALAQPGNPRPRLFRLAPERALINRLGFNNRGAQAVAATLASRLARYRPTTPIGINLGKSRVTPIEDAADDYRTSLRAVFSLADYVVINVSSPNTPGLRDLQSAAQLDDLLGALQAEMRELARPQKARPRPLLVKVAPDLSDAALREVAAVATARGAAGFVATNTTLSRSGLASGQPLAREAGGLSGAPLQARSTEVVRTLYRASAGRLPIIGVGGIFTAADAYAKIRAGASLVQVYTAFVYEGPSLPSDLCSGLRELLERDGLANVAAAVGRDA